MAWRPRPGGGDFRYIAEISFAIGSLFVVEAGMVVLEVTSIPGLGF